jgi:hypothetical protein
VIFRKNISPPSSGFKNTLPASCRCLLMLFFDPGKGGRHVLSKIRLTVERTARRYIPEHRTLSKSLLITEGRMTIMMIR